MDIKSGNIFQLVMNYHFIEDFTQFLTSHKIFFARDNFIISVNFNDTIIRLVPANCSAPTDANSVSITPDSPSIRKNTASITIYEDQWITKRSVIEGRLLSTFGKGEVVFARNCLAKRITTELAGEFLQKNHILGNTRSRYKYGLFTTKKEGRLEHDTLVCVATFSEPRTMDRGGVKVKSYEWVRYAALGSLRVTGGMGKLMNCFVQEIGPQGVNPQVLSPIELMSYADIDWSSGNSYIKLGFSFLERTKPLEFFIDSTTMKRYTRAQLLNSDLLKNPDNPGILDNLISSGRFYALRNQGNLKFIRRFF